jgi:hypothetical protein
MNNTKPKDKKKKSITWKFGGPVYSTKDPNIAFVRANSYKNEDFVALKYYFGSASNKDKPKEGQRVVVKILRW